MKAIFFVGRSTHRHIWGFLEIGVPKSSILMGFSTINQPFWGNPISGNPHISASIFHLRFWLSWSTNPRTFPSLFQLHMGCGDQLSMRCLCGEASCRVVDYGGFHSHGGTPSHHPFWIGIFPELNHPAIGVPHDYGNPHIL